MPIAPAKVDYKRDILRMISMSTYGASSATLKERFSSVHERSRQRYLNELWEEGLIDRSGSKNYRRWTVTSEGIRKLHG